MIDAFFYLALVVASIVGATFIIERGLALRWHRVVPPPVEMAVEDYGRGVDLAVLRHVCQSNPSPLSRLLLCAIEHLRWPRAENVDALQTRARHEVTALERGLVVLEIVVGIAPLLGLVGTVYGLINLFGGMAEHGLGDYARVAGGIGLAMYATLMGLLIAIPSLIAWSYYNKKVETMVIEMEALCDDFLRKHYHMAEQGGSNETARPANAAARPSPDTGAAAPAPAKPTPAKGR